MMMRRLVTATGRIRTSRAGRIAVTRRTLSVQPLEEESTPVTVHHSSAIAAPAAAPIPTSAFQSETRVMGNTRAVLRNDWTRAEIQALYDQPFIELLYQAATIHRMYWNPQEVQQCTLLSIKTGGCTEDCKYCSQSVRYKTHVKPTPQMKVAEVVEAAKRAKAAGSTRFCMGAAWRELGNKKNAFGHILDMVREVNGMGLEVCATLGMLNPEQARQLKAAGLTAYNHNLDTSPEYYPKVITTRSYEDRLNTLSAVRDAGLNVCSGGILGLGEADSDRIGLLHTLATLPAHPESVPINALVAVEGTPMQESHAPSIWDMGRMIATARIVMPKTMVRLSAGRLSFSKGEQALMFFAGANSIFNGDVLLTTPNPEFSADMDLFEKIGLVGKKAHVPAKETPYEVQRLQQEEAEAEANTEVKWMEEEGGRDGGVVVTRSRAQMA